MIGWVNECGKAWGRYLRYAPSGWATVSVMGRIKEYGPTGAAIRSHTDRIPIHSAPQDALVFNRAWQKLDGGLQESVFVFYFFTDKAKAKAKYLDISVASLYRRIDEAHIQLDHIIGREKQKQID